MPFQRFPWQAGRTAASEETCIPRPGLPPRVWRTDATFAPRRSGIWTVAPLLFLSVLNGCQRDFDTPAGKIAAEPMAHGGLLPRTVPRLEIERLTETTGTPVEFGSIQSIVADGKGQVFVADGLTQEIIVLTPGGRRLRTIGGRGRGPGEFSGLSSLAWEGDTLVALDVNTRRVTRFTSDGILVATWPWPTEAGRPVRLYQAGPRVRGAGLVVRPTVLFRSAAEAAAQWQEPETIFSALVDDGTARSFVAVHDTASEHRGFECDGPGLIELFPDPLLGYNGPLRAFVSPQELARVSPEEYRIDVIDVTSGDTVRTLERDYPALRLTDEEWADATRYFHERDRAVGPLNCDLESMRPEYLPIVRSMVSDNDGRLWVETRRADGYAVSVIDREGQLLGEASLPPRDVRVPLYVRNGRLYLVAIDEYDVQSLEVYGIEGFQP